MECCVSSRVAGRRLAALVCGVCAAVVALSAAIAHCQQNEPAITQEGGSFVARGANYKAVVSSDGCMSSLKSDGVEFLRSAPDRIPRGAYLYQSGLLRMADVTQAGPNVVEAKSDKGTIRYEFESDSLTWNLVNSTEKRMLFVVVFDPAVNAVQGDRRRWAKTPTRKRWKNTLWFRDGTSLRIRGGSSIWGPWSGNHQVWDVQIPPKGCVKVELQPGAATEAELAQAERVLHAPPPLPPTDPTGPMWDMARLSKPPQTWPAEGFAETESSQNVKAVFFKGLPYQGRETRVFAWIGLPDVPAGTTVPGAVLVHGGGGSAFATWVRRWTSRGYAAIAMDTCGCVPKGSYGHWEPHDKGGPPGWGGWDQIDDPREDQWTYHAVADAILAHSLLMSLPEVDAGRTGLTGISWGGYLTCIVAGVDQRFKFAVPVYGCGFTNEHTFAGSVNGLGPEGAARWMRWWDPSVYLPNASMPICWVAGSNDFAYTFNALQKSYRLPKAPRTLCIRLRMPHGHGGAGEGPTEIFTFADSIVKDGVPLTRLTGQGREGNQVWATFETGAKITKAELNVTKDTGKWPARKWKALPADIDPTGRVSANLPEGTTVYYLNLFDDRQCVVSTEHEELK